MSMRKFVFKLVEQNLCETIIVLEHFKTELTSKLVMIYMRHRMFIKLEL